MRLKQKISWVVPILVLLFLLILGLILTFLYLNRTYDNRNKDRTCIKKVEISISWNTPRPNAIGAYIVTYDRELIEAVKHGGFAKIHCVSKFLDSVHASGGSNSDLTLWTDTSFYIAYFADLSFVKNENQRLKLERSHQTDFYYELTDVKGKTWVIEPCK